MVWGLTQEDWLALPPRSIVLIHVFLPMYQAKRCQSLRREKQQIRLQSSARYSVSKPILKTRFLQRQLTKQPENMIFLAPY